MLDTGTDPFSRSAERYESLVLFLAGEGARELSHDEIEDFLDKDGRELLRQLFQDHLDLRALHEVRLEEVADSDGVARGTVEPRHVRTLETVVGEVTVARMAYRRRGEANLHPADGVLNLPEERHSHGLRRLCALESARGSFEDVVDAVERATGQALGKRQVEGLARRASIDFVDFYEVRKPEPVEVPNPEATEDEDVLVLSADGKGIVMRPDSLRPGTAVAAAKSSKKLKTRLSKGEKANRKRMATVGAVYDAAPAPRLPVDIFGTTGSDRAPGPVAKNKWLVASVAEDAASVVRRVFDEAERRDPDHLRTWVGLVDGNNHQIDRIEHEAKDRGVSVPIVIDLIHVLDYLWDAAWCFFTEGDPAAEVWVAEKGLAILAGESSIVAASIRRKATTLGLDASARANADKCSDYLIHKRRYLGYPTALERGWPIASGVIEGACRHLVGQRLGIGGARWSVDGAEAVLKLRALVSNGDFDDYWRFHIEAERRRIHESRYSGAVPQAA